MLNIAARYMVIVFLAAAVTSVWRWRRTGNRASMGQAVIFFYGAALYVYLSTDLYVLDVARWMVRFLLVALVAPVIAENIDAIRRRNEQTKEHD